MTGRASKKPSAKRKPRTTRKSDPAPTASLPRWAPIAGAAAGLVALVGFAVYVVGAQPRRAAPPGEAAPAAITTVVPESLVVRVHERHPHAREAFTQGLVWDHGRLFESTGLEGRSSIREVDLATGQVMRRTALEPALFGEGLALVGTELVQITWMNHRAFVWDRDRFEKLREFRYRGEGWGLCHDGRSLVMSDGSETLVFRNPATFAIEREVVVTRLGRPQRELNELECVDGKVWANVWQTDEIVRIDPRTGAVDAVVDATGLLSAEERQGADVLNGIAYVPETRRFLVTGKLWPTLFEVTFEAAR